MQNPVLYGPSRLSPYRLLLSKVSHNSMPCFYEFKDGHKMLQPDDVVSGGPSSPEGHLQTPPALAAQAALRAKLRCLPWVSLLSRLLSSHLTCLFVACLDPSTCTPTSTKPMSSRRVQLWEHQGEVEGIQLCLCDGVSRSQLHPMATSASPLST